jgi:ADP-dependent NAD(P)H-hydrate dehydratase
MPPSPPAERRLDEHLLRSWPLPHDEGEAKRSRGTVLVVGGSAETPGGVILAGTAALRAGAGRLQIATDPAVATVVAIAMPESMVVPFEHGGLDDLLQAADAVLVGPGLGDEQLAEDLLGRALDVGAPTSPLVVDALALRAVRAGDRAGRSLVLTPNREELQELGGDKHPRDVAGDLEATITLFGTVYAPDGSTFVDPDAAARGLGTSGSGDVLAGVAAGLAARCGDGVQAAVWASFLHRLAGERLADGIGPVGYLARELADEITPAMAGLVSREVDRP